MPKIASAKVLEVTGFTSENVRFCYKDKGSQRTNKAVCRVRRHLDESNIGTITHLGIVLEKGIGVESFIAYRACKTWLKIL